MRVALYVRVSTVEQSEHGYSIQEQTERLKKYCEAMDWKSYTIYTDPGYSGADTNRPGLQSMLSDIRSGKIKKVVVYKLDRLSRSQKDTLELIEDEFLKNNCDFISMNENFDTSTPFGRAMVGILAVFAQLEREQIKERMAMGKEARAKEGKWHGGVNPMGYDYIDGNLIVNEYAALQIREIYDRFISGEPLRAIETDLRKREVKHNNNGYWNPKQMRRTMSNKLYLGYIKDHDKWIKGTHEAIIDQETFDKANALLLQRHNSFGNTSRTQSTILGGLLFCSRCGARYGKCQYNDTQYYACYSRHKKVKAMIKDPSCKNKNYKVTELDEIILDQIRQLSLEPDKIHEVRNETPDQSPFIRSEIEKIDSQINKLIDLYSLDKISPEVLDKKITELTKRKEALTEELESISNPILPEAEVKELLNNFSEIIEKSNLTELRNIVTTLIDHIDIDGENLNIFWNF